MLLEKSRVPWGQLASKLYRSAVRVNERHNCSNSVIKVNVTAVGVNKLYFLLLLLSLDNKWEYPVAQIVEALRYEPEGRGFDSRWFHWNFSLTYSFRPHYGPWFDSASNRNE